ncbi:MAG: hypothetical protein ACLFUU_11360 [Desulfobacteraceae bacterium]
MNGKSLIKADMKALVDLRCYITGIVHHIPGQVRLRFSPGLLKHANQIDLTAFQNHGIFTGIEVNLWALAVTITYDPEKLPPPLWEAFLNQDKAAELEVSQILAGHQPTAGAT